MMMEMMEKVERLREKANVSYEEAKQAFEDFDLIGKKIAVNGTVRAFNLIKLLKAIDFEAVNGKDYLELTRIIKTSENTRITCFIPVPNSLPTISGNDIPRARIDIAPEMKS